MPWDKEGNSLRFKLCQYFEIDNNGLSGRAYASEELINFKQIPLDFFGTSHGR